MLYAPAKSLRWVIRLTACGQKHVGKSYLAFWSGALVFRTTVLVLTDQLAQAGLLGTYTQ